MVVFKGEAVIADTNNCLIENENGVTCGCGDPVLKLVMHLDSTDSYNSRYACKCGNSIEIAVKRSETEQEMWE